MPNSDAGYTLDRQNKISLNFKFCNNFLQATNFKLLVYIRIYTYKTKRKYLRNKNYNNRCIG